VKSHGFDKEGFERAVFAGSSISGDTPPAERTEFDAHTEFEKVVFGQYVEIDEWSDDDEEARINLAGRPTAYAVDDIPRAPVSS
jgi:hypothetical protein